MSFARWIEYAEDLVSDELLKSPDPTAGTISSKLWSACEDVANDALQSKFMQGLGDGTLDPTVYGQYIVLDCAYCVNAADDFKQIEQQATQANEPTLASYAKTHYTSYEKYVRKSYLPSWHINNVDALTLNTAAKEYIDHERQAVTTLHPIYGLIAQIPCQRLWPWLAQQVQPKSPPHNVYNFWITGNAAYRHTYLYSNYIDTWFGKQGDQYDHDVALAVLRGSMIGELNLFRSACDQSLTAMPSIPT